MLYEKNGALIRRFDKELLQIEPYGEDSLRIRATQLSEFQKRETGALLPVSQTAGSIVSIDGDTGFIQNGNIRCEVLCTGKLKFYNRSGKLLLEEVHKDRNGPVSPGEPESALELRPRAFRPHRETDRFKLTVRFEAKEDEKFYGMGQYSSIPFLNLKGCMLELAQRNSQISIPFTVSSRGYGFLWNNPAIGKAVFGRNITEWTADSTAQMDYWITAGDVPQQIMERYAEVTGKVPQMPAYGTGLWQSKLRYRTQKEVLEVAEEYKKRGLPLSVIVIDFFHWTAQGDWKFDPELWPDPEGMVRKLRDMGIELMVSIWPTVETGSENFAHMEEMGYLIRTEAGPHIGIKNQDTYFDATNPQAREFVWQKIKEHYYDQGIRLFWLDECEPEVTRYEYENYRFWLGTHKETGNIYPREVSKMVYEGRAAQGETEIVSLTRCAWAGSQRYGALVWTGDIASNFESLRNQIAAGLNMGLSGMPWWTTDIGGFHGGDVRSEDFRECLVRWFQFATFIPVLRMHGFREPKVISEPDRTFIAGNAESWKYTSGSPNELWSFGEENYEIMKSFLEIRECLRPYIDSLMTQAHEKGTPLMRPYFYEYPDDPGAWEIEDAYLFGPDILVAPVVKEHCFEREVYLPAGEWHNIFTGEKTEGGRTVLCKAPIEQIPVFVHKNILKYLNGEKRRNTSE
ncbi:MAG: glycoside hydrolase family 31 protein [Eubacteriales bacterium]|nr:glycoside hydrolase family 31 protein [Eubacteriales bacterium]